MASQIEELKATLSLERDAAARSKAALESRLAELEARNQSLTTQVSIATKGDGIPTELASDIEWRIRSGLTRDQAETVARRNWDERIKAEQAKAAPAEPAAEAKPISAPAVPVAGDKGAK